MFGQQRHYSKRNAWREKVKRIVLQKLETDACVKKKPHRFYLGNTVTMVIGKSGLLRSVYS